MGISKVGSLPWIVRRLLKLEYRGNVVLREVDYTMENAEWKKVTVQWSVEKERQGVAVSKGASEVRGIANLRSSSPSRRASHRSTTTELYWSIERNELTQTEYT